MQQIENQCQKLANARAELNAKLVEVNREIEAAKKPHMKQINAIAKRVAKLTADLEETVEQHPEDFEKPRTQTIHGIKVGYRTVSGNIEIPDEPKTIELIRKVLPDQESVLINVKESVHKPSLKRLEDSDLKKVKVRRLPDEDQVVVAPQDSETDKLAKALGAG